MSYNYKGHVQVMLFDAKTGEMTDYTEYDNLVTNFFHVIFEESLPFFIRMLKINNNIANLFNWQNFVVDMLGGMMIFSEKIEEDADHVYPTYSEAVTMIGNGNQEASIVGSSFKGAYNGQESDVTDSYARFVWDFSTTQCNGPIACICLTSNRGGHLGCRFDAKDSHQACRSSMMQIGVSNSGQNLWQPLSQRPPYPSNDNLTFLSFVPMRVGGAQSNGSLAFEASDAFYTRRGASISKTIKPSDFSDMYIRFNEDLSRPDVPYESITAENITYDGYGYSLNSDAAYFIREADNTLTLYKFTSDMITPSVFSVPTANIKTSIKEKYGIDCGHDNFRYIFNNKVIVGLVSINEDTAYKNTVRVYILDFDGTFKYTDNVLPDNIVALIAGTSRLNNIYRNGNFSNVGALFNIDGELFWGINIDNYGRAALHINSETGEIDPVPMYSMDGGIPSYIFEERPEFLKKPYFSEHVVGQVSSGYWDPFGFVIMPNYLATIHNLDTVFTKTPDKTMKIVYTLTKEE